MQNFSLKGQWQLTVDNRSIPNDLLSTAQIESLNKPLNISFPGDIYSALLDQKIISDPYYRKNELDVQWIGKIDWIAERTFNISKVKTSCRQFLTITDIDTFVKVFINEKEVLFCENSFRKYRVDITDALLLGKNTIKLIFESAERHAIEENAKLPYPVPCSVYDVFSPHRNLVRKVQCHAGWDWGPCLMTSGIYGDIQISDTSIGFIDHVETNTKFDDSKWLVEISILYYSNTNKTVHTSILIENTNPNTQSTYIDNVSKGWNVLKHTETVINPELWYPVGCRPEDDDAIKNTGFPTFNENTLYKLNVSIGKLKNTTNIAFRTLSVIMQNDSQGQSFYFTVNNRKIFIKGSNWIPVDALPSRQTQEKYKYLIDSTIHSNQNMLRIWGGGRYETDYFYELCDRKGVLIWQDFMFGCSTYPATTSFLDNVRQEVNYQVNRLKSHPCIALWCGNNENLGALNWYKESRENKARYLIDYDRLNEGVIGDEVQKNDPDRVWWPSSPCAGPGNYSDNWHSDGRGDMHYWSVWHEKKPFEAYYDITPRFVSEFGYQSFPSFSEVNTYTKVEDHNITSPVMEFHQRSPSGNSIIFENFTRYFRIPSTFKHILYLSQVQQAIAIKTAVDYWRSLNPICMGAIIWQLNDVWPVASWSSIEYYGKWKLLHYAAKKFFMPVRVTMYKKENTLFIYGLNDTNTTISDSLIVSCVSFNGNTKTELLNREISLKPGSTQKFLEVPIQSLPQNDCFITASFAHSTDTLFLASPKMCEIEKPNISYTIQKLNTADKKTVIEITLSCEKPAFYVCLDASDLPGLFSDNFITLLPGRNYTIRFEQTDLNGKKSKSFSEKAFTKAFSVTSLRDIY